MNELQSICETEKEIVFEPSPEIAELILNSAARQNISPDVFLTILFQGVNIPKAQEV
ncbi:MAG: hypothetical protein LUE08_07145 [Akkermansiaceae bacterium]|nr:hypothetical protein [Akkermansiaceae bacterium]